MSPEEERSGPPQAAPTTITSARIPTWGEVYECAELWVCWTARRRWPTFAVNDQIWASSVTDWETSGRKAAA